MARPPVCIPVDLAPHRAVNAEAYSDEGSIKHLAMVGPHHHRDFPLGPDDGANVSRQDRRKPAYPTPIVSTQ